MNAILLLITILQFCSIHPSPVQISALTGAWQNTNKSGEIICIRDNYFVFQQFDLEGKVFGECWGGPITIVGKNMQVKVEFSSKETGFKPHTLKLPFNLSSNLQLEVQGETKFFRQLDDGEGDLAGVWRITARKQGNNIQAMPLAARRTLKVLTATRFQWIAFNNETGEFSGTGGGTYSFKNGKYTEHIEFFSRDNNRVGESLSFDGKLENGNWQHSGFSSKGDPLYEIWSRMLSF